MRIALYGMPTAGKTHILNQIDFIEVISGSKMLRVYDPDFDSRNKEGREQDRKAIARLLLDKENFIMDGHYAFGNEIAFTEDDGNLYDVFLYLYISPDILKSRMEFSEKNKQYLEYDIANWQQSEIEGLREYCHKNNKDFYVIDNPPSDCFGDVSVVISFIKSITDGFSCVTYAKRCADSIIKQSDSEIINLYDGDKTLTIEDSSNIAFDYTTNIYDGNFYTGFQSWKQRREFAEYNIDELGNVPVHYNDSIKATITKDSFILTSGHERIWDYLAKKLGIEFFCGEEMAADTKYFITKFLQEAGKSVVAYGDGMNDYYMLKKADRGYLVLKSDGSISKSLKGRDTEGLNIV